MLTLFSQQQEFHFIQISIHVVYMSKYSDEILLLPLFTTMIHSIVNDRLQGNYRKR